MTSTPTRPVLPSDLGSREGGSTIAPLPGAGGFYINTADGRQRVAGVYTGAFSPDDWSGWGLVHARSLPDGYHVRLGDQQFKATVVPCDSERRNVRVHGAGGIPFMVWGGCLVWTYLG
jgi:hypothetical protein